MNTPEEVEQFFKENIIEINESLDTVYNSKHIQFKDETSINNKKINPYNFETYIENCYKIIMKFYNIKHTELKVYKIFIRGNVCIFEHNNKSGKIATLHLRDPTICKLLISISHRFKRSLKKKLERIIVKSKSNKGIKNWIIGLVFINNEHMYTTEQITKHFQMRNFDSPFPPERNDPEYTLPTPINKYNQIVRVKNINDSVLIVNKLLRQHTNYINKYDKNKLVYQYTTGTEGFYLGSNRTNLIKLIHSAPVSEPLIVLSFMRFSKINNYKTGDIIEYPFIMSTSYVTDNLKMFVYLLDIDDQKKIYNQIAKFDIMLFIFNLFNNPKIWPGFKINETLATQEIKRIFLEHNIPSKIFNNNMPILSQLIRKFPESTMYEKVKQYMKYRREDFIKPLNNVEDFQICCIGCITTFNYLIVSGAHNIMVYDHSEIILPPSIFKIKKIGVKSIIIDNVPIRIKHLFMTQLDPNKYKSSEVYKI